MPQPQQSEAEKARYPGRAKTHTIKVQYAARLDGLIIHKAAHPSGRTAVIGLF